MSLQHTDDPEIRVTFIRNKWHSRLIFNGDVRDEMACDNQRDIGWICRELLRQFDKSGGSSLYACEVRENQVECPIGKIWYKNVLDRSKSKE